MEFTVLSLRPKIVPWCRFSKFEGAWNPVCIASEWVCLYQSPAVGLKCE